MVGNGAVRRVQTWRKEVFPGLESTCAGDRMPFVYHLNRLSGKEFFSFLLICSNRFLFMSRGVHILGVWHLVLQRYERLQ